MGSIDQGDLIRTLPLVPHSLLIPLNHTIMTQGKKKKELFDELLLAFKDEALLAILVDW